MNYNKNEKYGTTPDILIDEAVTVFPVPTFLLLKAHEPAVPVTVSPDTIPDKDTVHVAVVFPLYVLLLALTLGVSEALFIVNEPTTLVTL